MGKRFTHSENKHNGKKDLTSSELRSKKTQDIHSKHVEKQEMLLFSRLYKGIGRNRWLSSPSGAFTFTYHNRLYFIMSIGYPGILMIFVRERKTIIRKWRVLFSPFFKNNTMKMLQSGHSRGDTTKEMSVWPEPKTILLWREGILKSWRNEFFGDKCNTSGLFCTSIHHPTHTLCHQPTFMSNRLA